MELGIELVISLITTAVSITSAFVIVKTKVAHIEEEMKGLREKADSLDDEIDRYREDEKVRMAVVEATQAAHAKELAELKQDIKTLTTSVNTLSAGINSLATDIAVIKKSVTKE